MDVACACSIMDRCTIRAFQRNSRRIELWAIRWIGRHCAEFIPNVRSTLQDPVDDIRSLVKRCNQGDETAWEQLYGRYAGLVTRLARRYCTRTAHDLEDLVQDVFLHLFRALRNYDPAKPLDPFVLEIARNVCISSLRHDMAKKRGGRNPGHVSIGSRDDVDDRSIPTLSSNADNAETALMKAQEGRLVRAALSLLSVACRKVLALRYDGGLTYAEISRKTNTSEGNLRVQVLRCLSALGREYGRLVHDREGRT